MPATSFRENNCREIARFLLLTLKVFTAIIIVDQVFRLFVQAPHPVEAESIKHEELLKDKVLKKEYRDIYYLGSSMTQSGINPEFIDLNMTQWNAGIAGRSNIHWQLQLINYIAEHKLAKHVVYAIEVFSFGANMRNEMVLPKSDSVLLILITRQMFALIPFEMNDS